MRTLLDRRRALGVLRGLGVAGALAACGGASSTSGAAGAATGAAAASPSTAAAASSAAGTLVEAPDETAGPYPGDGSNGQNVLDDSGIVRRDIRSSFGSSTTTAEGVPLTIKLTVKDVATSSALVGARDNVFGDDGGIHQLATMSGDVDTGYTAALTIGV